MNPIQPSPFVVRRSLVALASALCALPALAAANSSASTSLADAEHVYLQERAACLRGDTPQSQKDCMRDAGARLQMVRKAGGHVPTVDAQTLADNAMLRCTALPAADRYGCEQIVRGNGTRSSDGVRQFVMIVPAQ